MPFGPKHYAHTSEVYAKPSYLVPKILLRGLKLTELRDNPTTGQEFLAFFTYGPFVLRYLRTVWWKTYPSIPADSQRKELFIFDIFVSIELGLGGGRLDKLAIFRHFSPKNTFILFFSKIKEWKTFLMTWSFSFCSENCKKNTVWASCADLGRGYADQTRKTLFGHIFFSHEH